jgi:hypothetical protein
MKSLAVIAATVCMLGSGCVDLSPVTYKASDAGQDSGTPNSQDAGDASQPVDGATDPVARCRMCVETGPCTAAFATCHADAKCAIFAECMTETLCWSSMIADLSNVPVCVTDCGGRAMFTSQVDPSTQLIVPLLICAQDSAQCGSDCAP